MRARLSAQWQLRAPRERRVIAIAAALLGAVLFLWLIHTATHARATLRESVTTLRADAMRLDRDAAEIERLRTVPPPAASHADLRSLVETQGSAAGLSAAMGRLDAAGPDQVSVVLGAVAFADWLSLLQRLQAQHVRLESARIEALATPGMVSVTATFARAAAP